MNVPEAVVVGAVDVPPVVVVPEAAETVPAPLLPPKTRARNVSVRLAVVAPEVVLP